MQRNVWPMRCGHAAAAAVQWQLPEYLGRTRQLGNLYGFADTEVHSGCLTVGESSRCPAHTRLSTDAHGSSSSSGETCLNLRTENTMRAQWFKTFCTRFRVLKARQHIGYTLMHLFSIEIGQTTKLIQRRSKIRRRGSCRAIGRSAK